jgi:hypothetical protein
MEGEAHFSRYWNEMREKTRKEHTHWTSINTLWGLKMVEGGWGKKEEVEKAGKGQSRKDHRDSRNSIAFGPKCDERDMGGT